MWNWACVLPAWWNGGMIFLQRLHGCCTISDDVVIRVRPGGRSVQRERLSSNRKPRVAWMCQTDRPLTNGVAEAADAGAALVHKPLSIHEGHYLLHRPHNCRTVRFFAELQPLRQNGKNVLHLKRLIFRLFLLTRGGRSVKIDRKMWITLRYHTKFNVTFLKYSI